MTWPGHPTQLSRKIEILDTMHEPTATFIVVRAFDREQVGLYLDDSTDDFDKWLPIATTYAAANKLRLLVSIAPENLGIHHQPSVAHGGPIENMIEDYRWGMPDPGSDYPWSGFDEYQHIIVQYGWRGTNGLRPPSRAARENYELEALARVKGDRDRVWLF